MTFRHTLIALIAAALLPLCGSAKAPKSDLDCFTTPMAVQLKAGVTAKQVAKIKDANLRAAATQMLAGTYDTHYRYASYAPMLRPSMLGHQLSIGAGYSRYQGITGVILPSGIQTIVVSGLAEGKTLPILMPYWERRPAEGIAPTEDPNGWGLHYWKYELRNGVNRVDVTTEGLAYVHYFFDNPEDEQPVEIHFVNAPVNGYFNIETDDNAKWNSLLDNAKFPIMDAIGRKIQIAYPVEVFKKYTYGKGVELVRNYDSLVYVQHELMGLVKYKREPDNRILARVNYNYYMFRDGDGVAYMGGREGYAMHMVANPDRVIKGDPCWGFSHEVGHTHQLSPYLHWGGLGEVSNNIFTMYACQHWNNPSRLLAQNNFVLARKEIIDGGISYLESDDPFNRLVPFWQLQLYFSQNGYKDFYPDLFEAFRQQAAKAQKGALRVSREGNPAVWQLNFVEQVCRVGKTNLLDFFEKWGFFRVGEFGIEDYGHYDYRMTQEMVDSCKAAVRAMNLPAAKTDLTLLSD